MLIPNCYKVALTSEAAAQALWENRRHLTQVGQIKKLYSFKVTAISIYFADGTVGPTISLASVATAAGEDDDQSDSDYGRIIDKLFISNFIQFQVLTTSA